MRKVPVELQSWKEFFQVYVIGNKSRIEVEEQRRLAYYKEAYETAVEIAKALRVRFPDVEVYLIGSLTTDSFDLDSDIDIAVKQLLEEDYYAQ